MKWTALVLLAILLVAAGCSKEEVPVAEPVKVVEPAPPAPKPPEPGIEYADATRQQRYEAHFREYLTVFEPPEAGSPLWLKMKDGRRIIGRIASIGTDYVAINTTGVVSRIDAADLAMESRAQIFLADFARTRAMERVDNESAAARTDESGRIALRYAISDGIVVRCGPGPEFRRVDAPPYVHGHAIKTYADSNEWLRVSTSDAEPRWIHKYLTTDADELDRAGRERDLDVLTRKGIVVRIDPSLNVVEVHPSAWYNTDSEVRPGIARALAAYCAVVRKNGLIFITVIDAETQKVAGKYSDARGWTETER